MHNDNSLLTGTTSRTFNPLPQKAVDDKKKEKRENRAKLLPAYDIVINLIKKEQAHCYSVDSFNITPEQAQNHFIEVMARQRYLEYLKQLESNLNNIARRPINE